MGVGKITVKAVSYPLAKGTVKIPVEVQTSSVIPAQLAKVDVHIEATEQNGDSVICLDVHTEEQTFGAGDFEKLMRPELEGECHAGQPDSDPCLQAKPGGSHPTTDDCAALGNIGCAGGDCICIACCPSCMDGHCRSRHAHDAAAHVV